MPRVEAEPRISIIEDEPPMQELYTRVIESFGLDPEGIQFISTADKVQSAIHDPTSPPPSLVILDLMFREPMSGITVLKKLKEEDSLWKDVPVLVVTVDNRPGVEKTCLELGAASVVAKPFDLGVLQQHIKSALGKQP